MRSELAHALKVAGYRQGQRFEVCAFSGRGARSRWYELSPGGLGAAAAWLSPQVGKRNLYLLANPIKADAKRGRFKRALNEHCASAEVLLLDVDPCKDKQADPEGTAPEKLKAADEIAQEIRRFLSAELSVLPPLVSSGRGRQVWLRIKGEQPKGMRRSLVHGLARRFDRPGLATVDRSTHNAARLMRLPGSVNLRTGEQARILIDGCGQLADARSCAALAERLSPKPKISPRPKVQPKGHERLWEALQHVAADEYETWLQVGFALRSSGLAGAFDMWDRWSSTGQGYEGAESTLRKWQTFSADGGVTLATVYKLALQGGWAPPRDPKADKLLPLLETKAPPRSVTEEAEATRLVRSVLRGPKRLLPVVQDRRPTGSGKTTRAAQEVVEAAEDRVGKFLWASPSHDLARAEVLPALAKAGAIIWDEDIDADALPPGADVREVGMKPPWGRVSACKVPPFECPGPAVDGWTAESVAQAYMQAAARGWNPVATVCRACPKLLDGCAYWERRQEAAEADIFVVAHHALKGGASGRRALVVDEDPAGALIRRHKVDALSCVAFLALIEEALELASADVCSLMEALDSGEWGGSDPEVIVRKVALQEKLDKRTKAYQAAADQANRAERILEELVRQLTGWVDMERRRTLGDVQAYTGAMLPACAELSKACERAMRDAAKRGDPKAVRNLLPFLSALKAGSVLHVKRHKQGGLSAVLPVVEQLPKVPTLALDATGDPSLLELATGRSVATVEGELTAKLKGIHLADAPCGRRRYHKRRAAPRKGGNLGQTALHADADVVVEHARRVGAKRIGLVTFKGIKARMQERLEAAGHQVRALHYGGEVGSNAFAGWADLVAVVGTPFVPPEEVRLRASLEGASVEELSAAPEWKRYRLSGGGTAAVLSFPGEASQRAYTALVRARLEQSLGRAMRWEWVPPCGVLVLAEPWPTRHSLEVTTRRRQALTADLARLLRMAEGSSGEGAGSPREDAGGGRDDVENSGEAGAAEPLERLRSHIRKRIIALGGAARVAEMLGVESGLVRKWVRGEHFPEDRYASGLCVGLPEGQNVNLENRDANRYSPWDCNSGCFPEASGQDPLNIYMRGVDRKLPLLNQVRKWRCRKMEAQKVIKVALLGVGGLPELATDIGVSERTLRAWRSGATSPDPENGERLIQAAEEAIEAMRGESVVEQAIRLARGIAGLSEEVGYSASTVRKWRSGERNPGPKALGKLEAYVDAEIKQALELEANLRSVEAGEDVPGMGKVYATAEVKADVGGLDVPVAEPGDVAEQVWKDHPLDSKLAMRELKAWVNPDEHPGWLARAARRSKGIGSLVTWFGSARKGGAVEVDNQLALDRAVLLLAQEDAPAVVRRLAGRVAEMAEKRLAREGAE